MGPRAGRSRWIRPRLPTSPRNLAVAGPWLYFTMGQTLWKTDGTHDGTAQVAGGLPLDYWFTEWVDLNGSLLFAGRPGGAYGIEPYISDGTAGGTKLLKDIYAGDGSSNPK